MPRSGFAALLGSDAVVRELAARLAAVTSADVNPGAPATGVFGAIVAGGKHVTVPFRKVTAG